MSTGSAAAAAEQANRRQYLLEPVSATAYYERRGKREPRGDAGTNGGTNGACHFGMFGHCQINVK